jgi:hypothetical protein
MYATYLNNTSPVSEFGAEENVGVVEQTILQADDDKLRSLEPVLEQFSDMLCVR